MNSILWPRRKEMYETARLQPLKAYTYISIDKSPVSRYILHHYWEWVTRACIPLWMAPNLITLLGTACVFGATILALAMNSQLDRTDLPAWIHFGFAAALWTYSTLDNVDGKQARRVKASGPLGELFDHGCDSLVAGMGLVMQLASLGAGKSPIGLASIFFVFWSFYLPTWEQFHTDVLYLGVVNGPTEGILTLCAMYIVSGIFGVDVWRRFTVLGWTLEDYSLAFYTVAFISTTIQSLWNVKSACKGNGRSFMKALLDLLPFSLLSVAVYSLFLATDLQTSDSLPLFLLLLTVLFGRLATQIVYAHLLRQPFPRLPGLCIPLLASPVLSTFIVSTWLKPWLIVYFVVACVEYANWVSHVVHSFTSYLGIYCFSLKKKEGNAIKQSRPSCPSKQHPQANLEIFKTSRVRGS